MADDFLRSLQTHFGFTAFRPGQSEAIERLLVQRQDTLVVMPTGSGKSLVYQLAALHLPGQALVISPLIALMRDQVAHLSRHDVPATYINSTLPADEQDSRLRSLTQGAYRLAYVAPERLRNAPFQRAMENLSIGLLAVDEAHCISQWGHDFRPDYLYLGEARLQMGAPLTVALTATATPQVQDDICVHLGLETASRIVTGFNRPNLTFGVRYANSEAAKFEALQETLAALKEGAAIVYVGTRIKAEEVADFLRAVAGLEAEHYHAGLPVERRTQVQDAFLSGRLAVVAATNAFGMGIDRPDVRLVAHFDVPGTLEAYYQEAGRAGRDGLSAQAVLIYSPDDRALQEWFIDNGAPSLGDLQSLYRAVSSARRPQIWASVEQLSLNSGLPEVKLKVALAQLEKAGALQRLGDEGTRMLLDVDGWDEGAVHSQLALSAQLQRHRRQQLEQMIVYAETNQCRRRALLNHFGDRGPVDAPLCCDNCLSRADAEVSPARPAGDVASLSQAERGALIILDALSRLQWGVGCAKLSQLLKGSRAKAMAQYGYDKNKYYGCMAVYRQAEIEGLVQQLVKRGYLKTVGAEQPVLRLTPRGESALKARASIPLDLPRAVSAQAITRKQAERDAGGTVELTAQMFVQGLGPAEIAAQRGLSERTIYDHLARLIGQGRIELSDVVQEDIARQVRRAIEKAGGVSSLSALKAGLPDDISYEQIRCVVEDWRCAQHTGGKVTSAQQVILDCVGSLPGRLPRSGIAKLLVGSPSSRVEDLRDHEFYGRLPALGRGGVMREIDRLIERGCLRLDANGHVTRASAEKEQVKSDSVADFLARSRPRPLSGSWDAGWALGDNSRFSGAQWGRSPVGELTYQFKYRGDLSAVSPLVDHILVLFADQPGFGEVDAVIPVPSTMARPVEPVGVLAEALAQRVMLPVRASVLVKARPTAPQKDMNTLAQKRANVAGAFAVRGDVRGLRLLVLDDLFDSGATLEEISKVLRRAGAARLHVLTLTRTIHMAG